MSAVLHLALEGVMVHMLALLPGDPSTWVAAEYGGWITNAQNIARTIYMGLIVFDLIALAITTLLFRENLGEFFASIAFKVFMGGVFFWFIAYGPDLASAVIKYLANASSNFGGNPTLGPATVISELFVTAGFFFESAGFVITAIAPQAATEGVVTSPGVGFPGLAMATLSSPSTFILLSEGLGLMIIFCAMAIVLQFAIVTIESYLVMSVGTIMIGFAGSRFTFPFSQGYFSYMINVGIKLLMTYIILGVVSLALLPTVISAGAAVLTLSALADLGVSAGAMIASPALPLMIVSAAYLLVAVGVIWTIPAFTAALLTGQSQSSGAAILSQAVGSLAGAAQTMSQFAMAGSAIARGNQGLDSHLAAQGPRGGDLNAMSPNAHHDQFSSNVTPATTSGASTASATVFSPSSAPYSLDTGSTGGPTGSGTIINTQTGATLYSGFADSSTRPGGPSLVGMSSENLSRHSANEVVEMYNNTPDKSLISDDVWKTLSNEKYAASIRSADLKQAGQADEQARLALAYGLSGAAQAVPRDIGQPSAVQVRLSNPDKL